MVITKPTHYSVALKYERCREAPVCVAKGTDALALKIREVARNPCACKCAIGSRSHAVTEIDQLFLPLASCC